MPHTAEALQLPLHHVRLLALRRRGHRSRFRPAPAAGSGPSTRAGCLEIDLMGAEAGRLAGGASASTAGPAGSP
jgi:hypothetical protein